MSRLSTMCILVRTGFQIPESHQGGQTIYITEAFMEAAMALNGNTME